MAAVTPLTTTVTSALNSNTRSSYLVLNPGKNRVTITSASWDGTKTAALKYSPIRDDSELMVVKDQAGDPVEFIANDGVDIEGPGVVCYDQTGSDGVATTMRVTQIGLGVC